MSDITAQKNKGEPLELFRTCFGGALVLLMFAWTFCDFSSVRIPDNDQFVIAFAGFVITYAAYRSAK